MDDSETKATLKRVGIGVLIVVAAVLLIAFGVQSNAEKRQAIDDAKSRMTKICDDATVTKVIEETHRHRITKNHYENVTEYYYEVLFTGSDNESHTAQTLEADKEKRYAVGSKVTITYDPERPSDKCMIVRVPGFSTPQEDSQTDEGSSSGSSDSSSSSVSGSDSSSSSSSDAGSDSGSSSSSSSDSSYHTLAQDWLSSYDEDNPSSDPLSDIINHNYDAQHGSSKE